MNYSANTNTPGGLRRWAAKVGFETEWEEQPEPITLKALASIAFAFMVIMAVVLSALPFRVNSPLETIAAFGGIFFSVMLVGCLASGFSALIFLGKVPGWGLRYDKWVCGILAGYMWAYLVLPFRWVLNGVGVNTTGHGWNWLTAAGLVSFLTVWWLIWNRPGKKLWGGLLPHIGRRLPAGVINYLETLSLRLQGIAPAVAPVAPAVRSAAAPAAPAPAPARPFSLGLGVSTGKLGAMGHTTALDAGQAVRLGQADASQNIMIFGGIGSGKTTRMISPLLRDVFSQDTGALIFDIKTDFIREVDYIASITGRTYEVVGDGGYACNLLAGLTPQVAGSFIGSAFKLDGGSGDSAFWTDSATTLCTNVLRLLHAVGRFDLSSLYDYVFVAKIRHAINGEVDDLIASGQLDRQELRAVEMARGYFDDVFETLEDKVKSNVKATVAQVLGPFRDPVLQDAFCGADKTLPQVDFTDLIQKGSIFLVEIPQTKYGREGAKFVYLFVKLRFMMLMKERRMRPEWNQSRPVAFVCDEYQSIIDPISDTDFWDKSRSSKTVGIVSMQGFSSMLHSLKKHEITDAVMQNFRQVIAFPTEDQRTIEKLSKLLGHVDVEKSSFSENTGTNSGTNYQAYTPMQSGSSTGESWGKSRSVSLNRQDLIDGQLFRQMGQNDFLAILRIDGSAADDVLTATPLYVPDNWQLKAARKVVADTPAAAPAKKSASSAYGEI